MKTGSRARFGTWLLTGYHVRYAHLSTTARGAYGLWRQMGRKGSIARDRAGDHAALG
ncbi:MAG: hypothetical protein R3A51_01335 [Nannocystaceae bacterium]